jgi:hypothetical protein
MGAITPTMRATYGHLADQIPTALLERIDEAEILDRLDTARDLLVKADQAQGDLYRGYRDRARAVLEAEPRDIVEQQAQQWITKAQAAHTPTHASACRAQAVRVRAENPPAPRIPRLRLPTAEERRHAELLASVKADVAAAVLEATQAQRARLDALSAGVRQLAASASKTQQPDHPRTAG